MKQIFLLCVFLFLSSVLFAGEPVFSKPGGLYPTGIAVTLTPSSPANIIRYTLDGSDPKNTSLIYSSELLITSTTVVRAKEYYQNTSAGKTVTHTYLINFSTQLPVISLSTDPAHFFDNDWGIYVLGDSASPIEPYYGANYWKDWERPVHIEFFDTNKSGFSIDAGVKIFGGWTRAYPQKSLAIFARSKYGYNNIKYKIFPDLSITKFEAIVLRNSGNDWYQTLIRDGISSKLMDGSGVEKQAYRPSVVFLNGKYWGIHDIREKVNEHFIASHHVVHPDSINILENKGTVVQGDSTGYISLGNFINSNNLSFDWNYEYVKTKMDVDNFISYMTAQIYFDNTDWPGNNIKFWQPKTNGKWRWIMYDTDFGYGMYDNYGYQHNTLEFATATNGNPWPNPPWSTLFLRKLLTNYHFKTDFINRFADFANSRFHKVHVTNTINSFKNAIADEIPRHSARWNQYTSSGWIANVQRILNFADKRLDYMTVHYSQKFGLSGTKAVRILLTDKNMGYVKLNSLTINTPSWVGNYFVNIPVTLQAVPNKGFKFVKWEGDLTSTEDSLSLNVVNDIAVIPIFETDASTGIESHSENLPGSFLLYQNFPNPFNPSTVIKFYVPVTEKVSIKVYDLLGNEISTVTDKYYSPGNYEADFNASKLSTGVYFYRLRAGFFSEVKKMQVIK